MNILLTGGTGLIGRALCRRWVADGHRLWVWSRTPQRVAQLCGPEVQGVGSLQQLDAAGLDAVVNLAGAPIADRPWTKSRKALLWDSRVKLTDQLVEWLGKREQKPPLLISGSAVGWYGDGGEHRLTEADQPVSADFASQLCNAWEERAMEATVLGMRVVLVRTGLVLAKDGGFLTRLLPLFKLGLGGRLGNGRQWMPWIHIEDQIALIDFLLRQPAASGPYNACAPEPVRNADFTRSLGRALSRPTVLPVPAAILKPMLGELAGLLLGGQHVSPQRLQEEGFSFRFSDLDSALADLLTHP
ncbi:TIGR01777 family protein [Pseudomonas kunmingensis]|uniref:TIGR01777 family oxidoreductase n=1 Tax=Stutzerimonas kunmingensis TaxID=1211807 RepID=UPI0015E322B2|nr:TIGR01777 family oxidoreductase [Stutzerimonas kunmingensis]MBA1238383.1 TIGR01777 family protein [Stutzerimonas kunmingensis]MDH2241546.1 TIGR01777 family oxidoreductase [Pseudomonas sp. GD03909]MDH2245734.1 TIGR01777 family oxidoreductase [Pseudomonas sp. GD03856]MDH2264576.1 TIGR01777 family oxidoreductase [Pseudomonas sp. GD03855]